MPEQEFRSLKTHRLRSPFSIRPGLELSNFCDGRYYLVVVTNPFFSHSRKQIHETICFFGLASSHFSLSSQSGCAKQLCTGSKAITAIGKADVHHARSGRLTELQGFRATFCKRNRSQTVCGTVRPTQTQRRHCRRKQCSS